MHLNCLVITCRHCLREGRSMFIKATQAGSLSMTGFQQSCLDLAACSADRIGISIAEIPMYQFLSDCLPRQQWSLLNRFRTEQGHCDACRRKWRLTDTDLCPCGETQTMSHIVESCPLTKLNGGLSRLHYAVSWLTSCGS